VQIVGEFALVASSHSHGTTIADRIAQRTTPVEVVSYGLGTDATLAAARAITTHLRD